MRPTRAGTGPDRLGCGAYARPVSDDRHERFEALAVGHVLGGLSSHDASEFRSHLISCRTCRTHVAELRRLADDLSAVEREERQRAATMLDVAQDTDDEPPPRIPLWRRPAARATAGAFAAVLILGLMFWNFHLRHVNDNLGALAEDRAATVRILTEGERLDVEGDVGVVGHAGLHEGEIALVLREIPELELGQLLLVWRIGADGFAVDEDIVPSGAFDDGRLSLVLDATDVTRVVVSVETIPLTRGLPAGTRLAEVEVQDRLSEAS